MASSKMFSVFQLCGNKIKPTNERFGLWLLTENLCNDKLITDIGKIDYTAGEELLVQDESNLVPITEPFCDNIMLVKVCGLEDCQELDERRFEKGNCSSNYKIWLLLKGNRLVQTAEEKRPLLQPGVSGAGHLKDKTDNYNRFSLDETQILDSCATITENTIASYTL
ncbi:uncharacterized protein LOC120354575 [Nilaparvata lugens]|uniref:uncharacterized protein LOC120354575 n=1 Tax=Nilaparvata lugens TaxID=108931 RepID=UPI00193D777D|nr:uncharacterized protein LOC120354575 [Nilaparvata lugens]